MHILCLGGSYTALYITRHLSQGHRVVVLSRRWRELAAEGLEAVGHDALARWEGPVDLVIDTVPALVSGGILLDPPYLKRVDQLLSRRPTALLVHLSSTSVYPQGAVAPREEELPVVDEATPPAPGTTGGRLRLELENRVRSLVPGAVIVRAGGIYGPGRSLPQRLLEGRTRHGDLANRVVSRIHVEDLGRLLLALGALGPGRAPPVVNAVDARPTTNAEVFRFLREELGIQAPSEVEGLSPQGRRVVSRYLPELIGEYRFPTYREGFRHCLESIQRAESRSGGEG